MTLYFNRVHNYSQDCSLPYGPMKRDIQNVNCVFRQVMFWNIVLRTLSLVINHVKLQSEILAEFVFMVRTGLFT